jgi:predicted 3-demethylubiquinone-9 3-methyltransferase (glyoxalase superfamily)
VGRAIGRPIAVQDNPAAVQDNPAAAQDNPIAVQDNPAAVQDNPAAVQDMYPFRDKSCARRSSRGSAHSAAPALTSPQRRSAMSERPIVPCVWLDDQAEEAASFYTKVFSGGRVLAVSHYPASGESPSGKPPGSVLTVDLEMSGQRFTLLNGGPTFVLNPSISFFIHVDTPGEANQLFAALLDGGQALMPLGTYPWSERYGWVKDRFDVTWQVITGRRDGTEATIVPCLMFAGAQHGWAVEAL